MDVRIERRSYYSYVVITSDLAALGEVAIRISEDAAQKLLNIGASLAPTNNIPHGNKCATCRGTGDYNLNQVERVWIPCEDCNGTGERNDAKDGDDTSEPSATS